MVLGRGGNSRLESPAGAPPSRRRPPEFVATVAVPGLGTNATVTANLWPEMPPSLEKFQIRGCLCRPGQSLGSILSRRGLAPRRRLSLVLGNGFAGYPFFKRLWKG